MEWTEVFAVFVLCHLAGDYLLQTDFQALNKFGGLGRDPVARRALFAHIATYTLAFVPALVWIGGAEAVAIGAAIAIPHLLVDDGRALAVYMRKIKRIEGPPPPAVALGVDQTVHLLCLAVAAALV